MYDDDDEDPSGETLDSYLLDRRKRQIKQILLVAAIVIPGLIGLWYLLGGSDEELEVVEIVEVEPPKPAPKPFVYEPIPEPEPVPEPEPEVFELPPLDESDAFVRELAAGLSSRPEIASWLLSDDLVRRMVAAVDAVAMGHSPRKQLKMMWPRGKFETIGVIFQEPVTIDPKSFKRYDLIARAFESLDTQGTVEVYREIRPMIDSAYADLGYPDHDFDATLVMAIQELLSAPIIVGDPTLTPRVISFAYEDSGLEGLSAAQRQFLRMGPTNVARVQKKLREFAVALDVPSSKLPKNRLYNVAPVQR